MSQRAELVLCYGSTNLFLLICSFVFLCWLITQKVNKAYFNEFFFPLKGLLKPRSVLILLTWCVFQFPAGVQLLGVVCVLHYPRPPEIRQPRPLHSGKSFPPPPNIRDYFSIHLPTLSFHIPHSHLTYRSVSVYACACVVLLVGGGTYSHVSRWEDSGVVDGAGNHRHDPLILIAIP